MPKAKVKLSQFRCGVCNRKLPVEQYVYSRHTGNRYCLPGEVQAPTEGGRMTERNSWWPTYIAEHEAAHAIVAQKMGLRVAWVTINPDPDVDFFHMAATGIEIDGDDEDMNRLALDVDIVDRDTLLGVCASISAPSHLSLHSEVAPGLYRYSQLEADAAYEMGGRGGIEFDEIYDAASKALGDNWAEYCDLSQRLVAEGRVVFDTTSA